MAPDDASRPKDETVQHVTESEQNTVRLDDQSAADYAEATVTFQSEAEFEPTLQVTDDSLDHEQAPTPSNGPSEEHMLTPEEAATEQTLVSRHDESDFAEKTLDPSVEPTPSHSGSGSSASKVPSENTRSNATCRLIRCPTVPAAS